MPRPIVLALLTMGVLCAWQAWGADLSFQDPNLDRANVQSYQAVRNGLAVGPTYPPALLTPIPVPPDYTPACGTPGGTAFAIPITPGPPLNKWKVRVTSVDGLSTESCNEKTFAVATATPTLRKPMAPELLP